MRILGRGWHHIVFCLQFKTYLGASFYLGELAWGFSRVRIFYSFFVFWPSDVTCGRQFVSFGSWRQNGDASAGSLILGLILKLMLLSRSTSWVQIVSPIPPRIWLAQASVIEALVVIVQIYGMCWRGYRSADISAVFDVRQLTNEATRHRELNHIFCCFCLQVDSKTILKLVHVLICFVCPTVCLSIFEHRYDTCRCDDNNKNINTNNMHRHTHSDTHQYDLWANSNHNFVVFVCKLIRKPS